MNAGQVFDYYVKSLCSLYEKGEAESITYWILEEKLGYTRTDLMIRRDQSISEVKANELSFILLRLMKEEPVQYVLGFAEFYGLKMRVNRSVLIPRPETEELVDWIIKETSDSKSLQILDIGTGSGCIAIALKKNIPEAEIYGIDISKDALKVAEENAAMNQVTVHFSLNDILSADLNAIYNQGDLAKYEAGVLSNIYSVIVSNPPYVVKSERAAMHRNVVDFEPHEALFVADEMPLQFYEAIVRFAEDHLEEDGTLFFEIHEEAAAAMEFLLRKHGYSRIKVRKDINGKDRMVMAER